METKPEAPRCCFCGSVAKKYPKDLQPGEKIACLRCKDERDIPWDCG